MRLIEILVLPTQSGTEVSFEKQTSKYFAQEETLRLKRIAAASEKPHDTPSYSSTTVTAVSMWLCCTCSNIILACFSFANLSVQVGPQTEVLPTTHIYAALIILVLGVMLGKFFL